jgi:hypothetical protein
VVERRGNTGDTDGGTHEAALACFHWATLAEQTFAGRELD